jgi:carbon-monoxide dehydrogenase medium subunit
MRLARPAVVVDVNAVRELDFIRQDGELAIGALVRQRAAEVSPAVAENAPLLRDALAHVAHPAVRTRGTVGGSVAHADPASELPAVLRALDAEVVLRGAGGERAIPASDFFVSTFTTARGDDELVTEIRVPALSPGARSVFAEVARRHGDFALVSAAVVVGTGEDGAVRDARIALGSVADVPVRALDAERFLAGKRIDPQTAGDAARVATENLDPPSDVHASSEYRREVAGVLVRQALQQAAR